MRFPIDGLRTAGPPGGNQPCTAVDTGDGVGHAVVVAQQPGVVGGAEAPVGPRASERSDAPRPRASVSGIVANVLLGLAELSGLVFWAAITLVGGALSTSRAHPGMEPGALAMIGLPGLVPFGLAVVCNAIGLWKAIRGARRASYALCACAFLLGLVPWAVALWFGLAVSSGP